MQRVEMAVITKELAVAITKKLRGKLLKKAKAHDIIGIHHAGKLIATFGIRRASKKGEGHDYIPSQIFVSPRQARLLGQCPLKREDWIKIITKKGKV